MIRINLVRDRVPRRQAAVPARRWRGVLGGCVVAAAAAAAGWQHWSLQQRSGRLADELAAADRALRELSTVSDELARLESRRAELTLRGAAIDELRRTRRGAARLLDGVGRSVPDGLRLSGVRRSPEGVVIAGRAATLAALSDFVARLEQSSQVESPIEIVDSRTEEAPDGEAVRFELRAGFDAQAVSAS